MITFSDFRSSAFANLWHERLRCPSGVLRLPDNRRAPGHLHLWLPHGLAPEALLDEAAMRAPSKWTWDFCPPEARRMYGVTVGSQWALGFAMDYAKAVGATGLIPGAAAHPTARDALQGFFAATRDEAEPLHAYCERRAGRSVCRVIEVFDFMPDEER